MNPDKRQHKTEHDTTLAKDGIGVTSDPPIMMNEENNGMDDEPLPESPSASDLADLADLANLAVQAVEADLMAIQAPKMPTSWTQEMAVLLCREIESVNPFQYTVRTKERGQSWEDIAANIRKQGHRVTKRGVRDKYHSLKELLKKGTYQDKEGRVGEFGQMVMELVKLEAEHTRWQPSDDKLPQDETGPRVSRERPSDWIYDVAKRMKAAEPRPEKICADANVDTRDLQLKKIEMIEGLLREREEVLRRKDEELKLVEDTQRQAREARRRREEEKRREEEEEMRRKKEERDEQWRRVDALREEMREMLWQQMLDQNQMILTLLEKRGKMSVPANPPALYIVKS
ncbi:uncharacterized protein [Diadema setosum]|uniref:uncharacterized protein n=1 Tax=Diadema setosum TaxID=31175 RepID=UPI003B3AB9EA